MLRTTSCRAEANFLAASSLEALGTLFRAVDLSWKQGGPDTKSCLLMTISTVFGLIIMQPFPLLEPLRLKRSFLLPKLAPRKLERGRRPVCCVSNDWSCKLLTGHNVAGYTCTEWVWQTLICVSPSLGSDDKTSKSRGRRELQSDCTIRRDRVNMLGCER